MSKRFTDTEKWAHNWYRKLSPAYKCAWQYLCDKCDYAGVWLVDFEAMSFYVGEEIDALLFTSTFGEKLKWISEDKVLVIPFLKFQYGHFNNANKVHKSIITRIKEVAPTLDLGTVFGSSTATTIEIEIEKEIEIEIEKEKESTPKPKKYSAVVREEDLVIEMLNQIAGRSFKPIDSHKRFIKGRIAEGFTLEDFRAVIEFKTAEWKNDPEMARYLQPSTLFGNKFDGYLQAARSKVKNGDDQILDFLAESGIKLEA